MKFCHLILLSAVVFAFLSNACAIHWDSKVSTNSSSWSIYRQSGSIKIDLSSSIIGTLEQMELNSRSFKPYNSYYTDIIINDVRLRERISSSEGNYSSEDTLSISSSDEEEIEINYGKEANTDIYTFSYKEEWPVLLMANRKVEYSGRQINDRSFVGNNMDSVGTNCQYNHNFSKDLTVISWLDRMNATVIATDDNIIKAEIMPTKYLGYLIEANTTGVADFDYSLAGSLYNAKRGIYPALSEGHQRYYGTYRIGQKIEMRSTYNKSESKKINLLPCCVPAYPERQRYEAQDSVIK